MSVCPALSLPDLRGGSGPCPARTGLHFLQFRRLSCSPVPSHSCFSPLSLFLSQHGPAWSNGETGKDLLLGRPSGEKGVSGRAGGSAAAGRGCDVEGVWVGSGWHSRSGGIGGRWWEAVAGSRGRETRALRVREESQAGRSRAEGPWRAPQPGAGLERCMSTQPCHGPGAWRCRGCRH